METKVNSKEDPNKHDEIKGFSKKISRRDFSNVREGVVDEVHKEKGFILGTILSHDFEDKVCDLKPRDDFQSKGHS